jgi:hypothetical protein
MWKEGGGGGLLISREPHNVIRREELARGQRL